MDDFPRADLCSTLENISGKVVSIWRLYHYKMLSKRSAFPNTSKQSNPRPILNFDLKTNPLICFIISYGPNLSLCYRAYICYIKWNLAYTYQLSFFFLLVLRLLQEKIPHLGRELIEFMMPFSASTIHIFKNCGFCCQWYN